MKKDCRSRHCFQFSAAAIWIDRKSAGRYAPFPALEGRYHIMGYKTKQREYILAFLQNSEGRHITVAELVRHLQDNATPVGTATVYRTLEQLVEEGMVRKYVLDGKSSACYQFLSDEPHLCQEHFHLKCTCCGRLFHVSCDYLNPLGEHLLEHHGFVIDHTKTVLYGLCADCAAKEQEKKM